jgi:hypothetical protein
VNVPLAGAAFGMALFWLPKDSASVAARDRSHTVVEALDPVGIVLFGVPVAAILFFLLDITSDEWWLLVVFGVGLVAFFFWEGRIERPFVDIRLLRREGALARTYARLFLSYLCTYLITFTLSQWLQESVGLTAGQAGLAQVPTAVLAGVAALLVSRTTRVRVSLLLAAGLPLAGGLLFAVVSSADPLWWIIGISALFGITQGFASVSNQAALYRQAPSDSIGTAAGLSRSSIYLSAILASGLIGLSFNARPTDAGIHSLAWIIVAAAGALLALTVFDRTLRTAQFAPRTR